jgi:hypothetical protein
MMMFTARAAMFLVPGLFTLHLATNNPAFASPVYVGNGGISLVTQQGRTTVTIKNKIPADQITSFTFVVPLSAGAISGLPDNATTMPALGSDGKTVIGTQVTVSVAAGNATSGSVSFKTANGISLGTPVTVTETTTNPKPSDHSISVPLKGQVAAGASPPAGLPAIAMTGSTVEFDATTGMLTFAGDSVIDTGFAGDPLVGADVLIPSYTLLGLSTDGSNVVFADEANDVDFLQMQTGSGKVFDAAAQFLFYDIADNTFSTELSMLGLAGAPAGTAFDYETLAALSSPSLALLNNELNPGGATSLGDIPLGLSFTSSSNFGALTDDFAVSGSSGYAGSIFVTAAPEPASLWALSSGLIALVALWRRRNSIPRRT